MSENKPLNDLEQIRQIMERSTRFLSLSALSSILAGGYALVGAWLAYQRIYYSPKVIYNELDHGLTTKTTFPLLLIAIGVFLLAGLSTYVLSYLKARNANQKLWNKSAWRLLINFAIPLLAGGLFSLVLFWRGYYDLLAASTLIFYGLALLNASNFTFSDIRWLGLVEISLGLMALVFVGKGLLFWALGFGIFHILYGILMYVRHEST